MKKYFLIASVIGLLSSCSNKQVCMLNEKEVNCRLLEMYNELMVIEGKINETFADNAPEITFEEEYGLRESWVTLYDSKKDSMIEAIKIFGSNGFSSEQLYKMRSEEFEYFKTQKVERAKFAEFAKQLSINEVTKDTAFYEGSEPEKYLIWTITNNSDSTINGFYIKKQYLENGKSVKKSSFTNYFFSEEQLNPKPAEGTEAYLLPGGSVVLSFELSDNVIIKPELVSANFK